jgi:trk system potassium uptake protein TrkH
MIIYYKTNPARFMLTGFVLAILIGTFVLLLPQSTTAGHISLVDALFTATSAVCVTGLIVLDTPVDFTMTGQLAILTMIQLGGIGIVFFSVLFTFVFMGKVSVGQKSIFSSMMTPQASWEMWGVFRTIFIFTITVEILGAIFMFQPMLKITGGDTTTAIYYSVFHSISGFCNAGFSLFSDSFMGLRYEPLAVIPLMFLIVFGGVGFFIIDDIIQYVRTKGKRNITLHSKMVLIVSGVLILGGAVMVFFFESFNSIADVGLGQKVIDSLFMSVTARTAGFNTIDIGGLSNPTLFVVAILMFIGASPGSTGGGVKTSTMAVIWALIRSRYRASEDVMIFKRTIPRETISNAQAILASSAVLVITVSLLILFSEITGGSEVLMDREYFVSSFFEVASAFGTVGLSMGITNGLNSINKIFVMLTMFIGRLGPLTFLLALQKRRTKATFRYAEEDILVG